MSPEESTRSRSCYETVTASRRVAHCRHSIDDLVPEKGLEPSTKPLRASQSRRRVVPAGRCASRIACRLRSCSGFCAAPDLSPAPTAPSQDIAVGSQRCAWRIRVTERLAGISSGSRRCTISPDLNKSEHVLTLTVDQCRSSASSWEQHQRSPPSGTASAARPSALSGRSARRCCTQGTASLPPGRATMPGSQGAQRH